MTNTNNKEVKFDQNKTKKIFLIISISMFIASLFFDCYCTGSNCSNSLVALILGPLGVLTGGACTSWLANPLLLLTWILFANNKKFTWIFSLLAFIFCISFLFFSTIIINEAGMYGPITKVGLGYWLWLLSIVSVFFASVFIKIANKNR